MMKISGFGRSIAQQIRETPIEELRRRAGVTQRPGARVTVDADPTADVQIEWRDDLGNLTVIAGAGAVVRITAGDQPEQPAPRGQPRVYDIETGETVEVPMSGEDQK